MAIPKDTSLREKRDGRLKSHRPHHISILIILILGLTGSLVTVALLYNNISLSSDKAFADSLNASINRAIGWVVMNESKILSNPNVALLKMLDDCDQMCPNPAFSKLINSFMSRRVRPNCWKALIDPNWPVQQSELNTTIKQESIDNKWILYAIAPEKASVTPGQIGLFDRERWHGRQLTHQLWALIYLRERTTNNTNLNKLIEHLSDRIAKELNLNIAVVDIYIQKVAFVLKAGFPEKIRMRWIERIMENQYYDGGWNDRWFCFTSRRRPVLKLHTVPTDRHTTIQALWLLYQVKYRYAEHFGIEDYTAERSTKHPD